MTFDARGEDPLEVMAEEETRGDSSAESRASRGGGARNGRFVWEDMILVWWGDWYEIYK